MKTSQRGIELIKSFESLHDGDLNMIGLQPKMDPIGIWTEGWGRVMRKENGMFLTGYDNKDRAYAEATIHTEAEADAALMEDLKSFETIVARKIHVPLNSNQHAALVSHTYNTGGSATLFRLINQNAPAAEIRRWWETKYVTAQGMKLRGLVRRRKAEAELFFTAI